MGLSDRLANLFRPKALELAAAGERAAVGFALDPTTGDGGTGTVIDPAVVGLPSYSTLTGPVTRDVAMTVPAVKRARDLIAGSMGQLPVVLRDAAGQRVPSAIFDQPEPDMPRSVTMTRLADDLLFYGIGWWRVLAYDWRGYPARVRRLDPRSVTVAQDGKVYTTRAGHTGYALEWVPDAELVRFDSPNDPLLIAGARAIRTCLALDEAAARYASEPLPLGYFTPADGVDPAKDDDITEILDAWMEARQARATGYVPAALKYNAAQFNPEQMQLAQARQHAVLEISRLTGIDAEELGVPQTTRTYYNAFDRRKSFTDFTAGGYRQAIEDRLSMGDVTPRGYTARLDLDAFFRSDPLSRYQAYAAGLQVGALTPDDVAEAEGKRPGTVTPADPATLPAPAENQDVNA